MQNLAVRSLYGGNGYQGSGRRYPVVRLVLSVSSHVGEAGKATSPQGHVPGQPRCHCRGRRLCHGWMQEGMEALASGVHPPQPGRTRGCPGLYLWSAGIGGQSSRGSGSTSPGRSAVTSRPRLRLQPVSSYSRSRAPCHHTTPRRLRRCRAPRELRAPAPEPARAPPGCGSTSPHIPFPAFSSASLHIHFQTPVSR